MPLLRLEPSPFVNSIKVVTKTEEHPNRKRGHSRGYSVNGVEGADLLVERWKTYQFELDADGGIYPLYFTQHDSGGVMAKTFSFPPGPSILGDPPHTYSPGRVTLTVDRNFPQDFLYQCLLHEDMGGRIGVKGETNKLFPPPTSWASLGEELDPTGRFIIKTQITSERSSFSCVCEKITKHPLCDHTFHPKFLSAWLKYQKTPSADLCPGCFGESYADDERAVGVEGGNDDDDDNNGRGRKKKKKEQTDPVSPKRIKPSPYDQEGQDLQILVEAEIKLQEEAGYDRVLSASNPKIWLSKTLYDNLSLVKENQLVKREELMRYRTQGRSENRERIENIKETFSAVGFWQHVMILNYNATTGNMWLTEGHHRLIASTELGLDYVPAYVYVIQTDEDEMVVLPTGIRAPPEKLAVEKLRQSFGIGLISRAEPSLFGFSVVDIAGFNPTSIRSLVMQRK